MAYEQGHAFPGGGDLLHPVWETSGDHYSDERRDWDQHSRPAEDTRGEEGACAAHQRGEADGQAGLVPAE